MAELTPEPGNAVGCARTVGVFLLLVAPIYALFRFFIRLVRVKYGFIPDSDVGPPLRVCLGCHNTVLEDDFSHCPYCGEALPARSDSGLPVRDGPARL